LYAFPEEDVWHRFPQNIGHWGDGRKKYNPEEDAFRKPITPPEETQTHQENPLIAFDSISHDNNANLHFQVKTKISYSDFWWIPMK
jgi:hypothetical protein